ncbi:MAG: BspA family leucine-rich repeat surface protein, partial [Bacteroidota bacterium]
MKNTLRNMLLALLLIGPLLVQSQSRPFITTWTTTTDPETVSIPLTGSLSYNFTYVWKNAADGSEVTAGTHTNADGAFATELPTAGSYLLEITGSFPHFQGYPKASLIDVNQWGDIAWGSFDSSFEDWPGSEFSAEDAPDLSGVTSMFEAFRSATNFNDDLSSWDVSTIVNMRSAFRFASSFNSDISSWIVSNVTNMEAMFQGAVDFNIDISNWNVSRVTTMHTMFAEARSFN